MSDNEYYGDPAEIRHRIGATGTLTIQNVSGSVELLGADTDEAVVRARGNGRSERLPITVRRTDGGLHIELERQSGIFGLSWGGHAGVEFEATVPRGARVDINSVSADISARLLAGDQAYKTVSGEIEIDPEGGRVRASTVSGDVRVRAGEPVELSVNTTSGDVRVSGAVINALDVHSVSGDVDFLAGLAAGPVHSVETVSGDLSVDSQTGVSVDVKRGMDFSRGGGRGFVTGDGSARLRFRTLSGDAHVEGGRKSKVDERSESQTWTKPPWSPMPPPAHMMPPTPPMPPTAPAPPAFEAEAADPQVELEVLRALERGEIDVDEASRRLAGANNA